MIYIENLPVYIVLALIILGILYFILKKIFDLQKTSVRKNEDHYRSLFAETCKELGNSEQEIKFDKEGALFHLQINDNTVITYDPTSGGLSIKVKEDLNYLLPDANPENLCDHLKWIGKKTNAFDNCELKVTWDSPHREYWYFEISIHNLRKGQLTDIKNALDKFEADEYYVHVSSDRIYHKVHDLEKASKIAKKAIKAVCSNAVVYHKEEYWQQNTSEFMVLVYVKKVDATPEILKEIKLLINDLPIGDNSRINLADGSIWHGDFT